MKFIAIIAGLLVAASNAAVASSSVIYSDYDLVLAQVGGIKNACLTDSSVETINPIEVCLKLNPTEVADQGEVSGSVEWVCSDSVVKKVSVARTFNREQCTKWATDADNIVCAGKELVQDKVPAVLNIVTVKRATSTSNDFPGTSSTVTLPNCQ